VFGTPERDDVMIVNMTSQSMAFCGPNFCAMDAQNDSVIEQPSQTEVGKGTIRLNRRESK